MLYLTNFSGVLLKTSEAFTHNLANPMVKFRCEAPENTTKNTYKPINHNFIKTLFK